MWLGDEVEKDSYVNDHSGVSPASFKNQVKPLSSLRPAFAAVLPATERVLAYAEDDRSPPAGAVAAANAVVCCARL